MYTGRRSGWKWCLFANVLGNIPIKLLFQIKLNSQLWMETRLTTAAYTLIMMICRINVQVSVRVLLCVSSVPASCVHIWFVSCPC